MSIASNTELLWARQHVVAHCRAFKLQPIDVVNIHFKDTETLRREAVEGAAMGFAGKQIIHPNQIDTVQEAFAPDPDAVAAARALVEAFNTAQGEGTGAFDYHGKMIDMPTVLQAKNLLDLADSIHGR